mgnify:CR=1 FL=1
MTGNTRNRRKGAFAALPPGYELYRRIDLTQDRAALKAVVLFGMTAALALIVPMLFVHSPKEAFDMPAGARFVYQDIYRRKRSLRI